MEISKEIKYLPQNPLIYADNIPDRFPIRVYLRNLRVKKHNR
jgi:hypothetical protein